MKRSITVGLLWHSSNSSNLGVGALTVSQMHILDSLARDMGLPPVRYIIMTTKDGSPHYIAEDRVEILGMRTVDLLRPDRLLSRVLKCDFILDIGAGDSFTDIYGPNRIRRMLVSKFIVHGTGRPMVLSPQTMGPFSPGRIRQLAMASVRRCRAVFARDQLSADFLREAGFDGPVGVATDVAMRLPYDPPAPVPAGKVRVGLNVSGLLMGGGYSRNNMFGLTVDYPALIRAIIADFQARPEVELHLVPHVVPGSRTVEDDEHTNTLIAAEIPGLVLAPRFKTPSEAKTYIAGLDFFMGARMHATIAAFSSGVPVVPMAYSRKFEGVFGSLGYGRTVDLKSIDNATALARIREGYEHRAALAGEVAEAYGRADAKLRVYEATLAELLAEAAAKRGLPATLPAADLAQAGPRVGSGRA